MKKYIFPQNLKFISPLLLAGVLLLFLLVFTFMGKDRIDRQKEFLTQRLLEKGVSVIRTFEAGTRAGMFTMQWGARRIQTMISEASMQPEVKYLMITSKDGHIRAHSDASMVGRIIESMPKITENEDPSIVYHRVIKQEGNTSVFEIMKKFTPIAPGFMKRHPGMRGKHSFRDFEEKDWSRPYFKNFNDIPPEPVEHYIFAGLSMERTDRARERLIKETILNGVVFFLVGCAVIFALFTFQAYRTTRASLDSVKAFSDNVIQHMPTGLVTISSDNKISSMNKAAKKIFGKTLSPSHPIIVELIDELKTHKNTFNREINFTIDSENTIPLDITASLITDTENKITEFLFLFRDLTQVKELKKQVDTNKRLAAIGKLAAGVAHEIRNPLSSIKGFVTYLGKKHDSSSADKETTQVMVGEVERINRSITQLLEFAKPMAVDKERVGVESLISHSLKLVQTDLRKKNIKAKININTKKTSIITDKERMNQVLLNLYINAVEAMEKKGSLEINVTDSQNKKSIDIKIKDTGKGIDETSLDQIFDPYYTTKPTGTGLGLSIVHRIVETLGGTIRAESKKGQGSSFILEIPVS